MDTAEWLTLLTLIATVATLLLVLANELRARRQYRRVDFDISPVGTTDLPDQKNDRTVTFQVFEITNCGVETATRISMMPVNYFAGVHPEFRPVTTLTPGETKRFLAQPAGELDECWTLISYFATSDKRFMNFVWHDLDSQKLFDILMQDMDARGSTLKARHLERWKTLTRRVESVGPGAAPRTRVRVHRGDSTEEGFRISSSETIEWMERWKALAEADKA